MQVAADVARRCLASSSRLTVRRHLDVAGTSSSSFSTSSSPTLLAPQPPAVSSNASTIMHDENQLGRHFYLNTALDFWASKQIQSLTLQQLLSFGRSLGRDPDKIFRSANFVREELPVRIAQRIRDMQNLPFVVMTNAHLGEVYHLYWKAFDRFRKFPAIRSHEDNEVYVKCLKDLLEEHLTVIPSLALGVVEVSEHIPAEQLEMFMQRMLKSRISRRVLAEQHIALTEALDDPFTFFSSDDSPAPPSQPEHIGIIHTHLSVQSIIRESIDLLTRIFAKDANLSPEEALRTKAVPHMIVDGDLDATISYIPEHLSFIVFELIKDAMRAVMRFRPEERDDIPLRATIVEGPPEDDIIIRISDCGGGVSDLVSRLASYPKTGDSTGGEEALMVRQHHQQQQQQATMPSTSFNKNTAIAFSASTSSPLSAEGAIYSSMSPTVNPQVAVAISPSSTLTDVLCSFSHVRRRLELEEEARRAEAKRQEAAMWDSSGTSDNAGQQPADASSSTTTSSILLGASAQAGLGSRSKLEHLRRIGRFKGTVGEQVQAAAPASSPSSGSNADAAFRTSLSSTSLGLVDTGLGLPMARVYAEFFGGSLQFRSLDGHGQDVYIRVPKLGTVKEGTSEIGL